MSLFVSVTADLSSGKVTIVPDDADKKLVWSQAMKSFRQEQRRRRDVLGESAISANEAWKTHRKRSRRKPGAVAEPFRQVPSKPLQDTRVQPRFSTKASDQEDEDAKALGFSLLATCIAHMMQKLRLYIDALTDNFIDGYFAPARYSKSLASIMVHWARPTSLTFETGNNSLGLLHFGAAIGDQRIIKHGQRLYLDTLNMVRRDIQSGPGGDRIFESMFASAQDLLNCEIYSAVSCGFKGWAAHLAGINAIVKIPGFKTMNSVFSAFMSLQFRHIATIYALVTRPTALIPEYCLAQAATPASPGTFVDCLKSSSDDSYTQKEHLENLAKRLDDWSQEFHRTGVQGGDGAEEGIKHFMALGLAFQKCLSLLVYEIKWIYYREDETIQKTANRLAMELLKDVSRLAETTAGEVGKALAVRAPLHFVGMWYQQSENRRALKEWTDVETGYRDAFPYLDWGALLPLSFLALLWIG